MSLGDLRAVVHELWRRCLHGSKVQVGRQSRRGEKRTKDNFSSHFFRFFSLRLTTLVHWPSSWSPGMALGRSDAGEDGETGRCRFMSALIWDLTWKTRFEPFTTFANEQTKAPRTSTATFWRLQAGFHTGEEGIAAGCAGRLTDFQDVAESLGIAGLPDVVASALASDVEYRIHQVVEVGLSLVRLLAAHDGDDRKLPGSCDTADGRR